MEVLLQRLLLVQLPLVEPSMVLVVISQILLLLLKILSLLQCISQDGWFGASDWEVEGTWKWLDGPESGTVFWISNYDGKPMHMKTGQASNQTQAGNEDCSQFYANGSGWNDLSCSANQYQYLYRQNTVPQESPNCRRWYTRYHSLCWQHNRSTNAHITNIYSTQRRSN